MRQHSRNLKQRTPSPLSLIFLLLPSLLGLKLVGQIDGARVSNTVDIKDKIIEFQCYAKCTNVNGRCLEQCMLDMIRAPRRGQCPSVMHNTSIIFKNIPPTTLHTKLSCLDNCQYDYDCPEVQRCCPSTCGPICMDAIGVRDDPLLPPIPKVLDSNSSRRHKVELTIESSLNTAYFLHVEARHHIGTLFSPRKLGAWYWQPVTLIMERFEMNTKRTEISFSLRPGRWYQVRVAAINENGFRGYSEPSRAFTLKDKPKPPKAPADLKVIGKRFNGKQISLKITWCPSKSNMPVEKYKIIWSLYVLLQDESIITSEAYVKDTNLFEITQLEPDSSYYIQVQAMAISGSKRLKSDKISLLYNTTRLPSIESYGDWSLNCTSNIRKSNKNHEFKAAPKLEKSLINFMDNTSDSGNMQQHHVGGYDVRFRLNRKFGMIVQISGFQPHREKVYELCPKQSNCEQREFSAIRVKKDSLEFSKLKYNTTYVLKALKPNSVIPDSRAAFTFTTPKCENFRKRFPKMQIIC